MNREKLTIIINAAFKTRKRTSLTCVTWDIFSTEVDWIDVSKEQLRITTATDDKALS